MLLAAQRQVAEHAVPALFEAAQLHEAGLDGVPQAHAEQQEHKNVVAQVGVDVAYNGIQGAFDGFKHGYLSPLKTKEVADTKISNSGSSIQLSGEEKRCDDVKTSCFSVPLPERFDHHGLAPSALNSMSSPEFPRKSVTCRKEEVKRSGGFKTAKDSSKILCKLMMNFYIFNEWKMEYHSEKESRRKTLKNAGGA